MNIYKTHPKQQKSDVSYRYIRLYQIMARRLFSLLPANSRFGLYYAQRDSFSGALCKLTWLVFISNLVPYINSVSNVYLEDF